LERKGYYGVNHTTLIRKLGMLYFGRIKLADLTFSEIEKVVLACGGPFKTIDWKRLACDDEDKGK